MVAPNYIVHGDLAHHRSQACVLCHPGGPIGAMLDTLSGQLSAMKPAGRSDFSAKPTTCARGHRHPSKLEARVCAGVYAQYDGQGEAQRVYRNVRLPLWALPPTETGIPMYASIDFAVWSPASEMFVALIDAKPARRVGRGRQSRYRDWARGCAAVQATYGVKVEERHE